MLSGQTHVDAEEIDFAEQFFLLWGRKISIAIFMIGFACLGFLYSKSQTAIYQTEALIQLEERSNGALPIELQGLPGASGGRAATEIEILKSRGVASEAVDALNLHIYAAPRGLPFITNLLRYFRVPHPATEWLTPYSWSNETIKVGLLRAPPDWTNKKITIEKTSVSTFIAALPNGKSVSGQIGVPIENTPEGLALRIDQLTGDVGREFVVSSRNRLFVATDLSRGLNISEVGRQSSILRLSYRHPKPALGADILNAVLAAYVRQNVERGSASASKSLEFIEGRIPDAEAQLEAAQFALNSYQQQISSVDLTFTTQQVLASAAQIEAQLNELELAKAELTLSVTPNHPSYKRLEENQEILEERLAALQDETKGLPAQQIEVFNLNRDVQVGQQIYQSLLERRQELQVVRASTIGNIRVLDSALPGRSSVKRRTARTVALSLLLGLICGIAAVLIPRVLRQTINGVEDLEKLGLPVFASVGYSSRSEASSSKSKSPIILAITHPTDLVVEALRSLRTSLHFGMIDAKSQSLLITSTSPEAGKSFTSVNLAAVMAQSGKRVVVVDADLRRGTVRKYFDAPRGSRGLSEVLSREAKLAEVVRSGPIDNLFYVSAGNYPPNPSELLMRAEFEEMIKELSTDYDFVIVDAPPVLAVTDPVILSKYVGATMMVVMHKKTTAPELEAAKRVFENAGSKFTGVILNGYRAEASNRGGYYYYYNKRYSYEQKGKNSD